MSRFIPADAGNTRLTAPSKALTPVHPRGCGEYFLRSNSLPATFGSSPRMRGIPDVVWGVAFNIRFIPADAGNTAALAAAATQPPVHPRGCGEYIFFHPHDVIALGSSPRMRGIRRLCVVGPCPFRFIPADAGNTRGPQRHCARGAVHPRGCGEYVPPRNRCMSIAGSSPRMRGIRC